MAVIEFEKEGPHKGSSDIDNELETLLQKQSARVKVIGCGGGGGNSISRMKETGIKGCEIIAVNTDAQDLLYTNVDSKILIGRELTNGLGAGSNPKIGEQAAKESEQEIRKKLADTDLAFITCGLGGGCLRGSSLIPTNPHGPVRIDEIKPGSMVYAYDDDKLVKRRVLDAVNIGIKKLFELKTKNRTTYASYDHPFLKVIPKNELSGGRFSDFTLRWTELKDLKAGDLLVVAKELPENSDIDELPREICHNKDFCQLFGFLLGDGWLNIAKDTWKICLSISKNNNKEKYLGLFEKVFESKMKKSTNWYYFNSKEICETLKELGLHKRAKDKEIPEWVFALPKESQKAFIIGLADSDGSYSIQVGKTGLIKKEIKFEMSSEKLIRQLKMLCDGIGLRTSNVSSRTRNIKAPNSKEAKDFTSWTVRIYKTQNLTDELPHKNSRNGTDFLYKFRNRKLPEFFNNFGFNRIVSIKEAGEEELFDITVEKSQNFVADGFLVHNTGTGSAPIISEIAKKSGALTIGIVTLPFTVEGQKRIENAQYGLERMAAICDTLIVIPNDKLLEIAPDLPIHTAFKVADEILTNAVKGITELITKAGLVNLDFADVRAIMTKGGVSLIGIGESDSQDRAREAVEKAINNPLLDVDMSNASGALVNIIGGNDFSLNEYKKIMQIVGEKVKPDAKIISGAQISPDMENSIKVLIIATGVKSDQITGISDQLSKTQADELEEELGINFLEE